MSVYPVINQQFGVIGEGDIDDCWCVATIWAARGADRCSQKPTIPEFRKAAGNPDDPYRADGGNIDQIAVAVPKLWPLAKFTKIKTLSWTAFMSPVNAGDYITVAVNSAHLPSNLRFGFYGPHQVGIVKSNGVIYCANPLAKNGSDPIRISEAALKYAVKTVANGWILAGAFDRIPVHLKHGGVRAVPFPDTTTVKESVGYLRSAPKVDAIFKVRPLRKGETFEAYQYTNKGDPYKGSSRWAGDHKGGRWVHASRLTGKGGST